MNIETKAIKGFARFEQVLKRNKNKKKSETEWNIKWVWKLIHHPSKEVIDEHKRGFLKFEDCVKSYNKKIKE